jgi:RimJ/RimL family protein N-acetyltransferase
MGYATEAARRVVEFAFDDLQAPEVWAGWFHDNPNSGHVLAKVGFRPKDFEARSCMARGMEVGCNIVTLTREAFVERRLS